MALGLERLQGLHRNASQGLKKSSKRLPNYPRRKIQWLSSHAPEAMDSPAPKAVDLERPHTLKNPRCLQKDP